MAACQRRQGLTVHQHPLFHRLPRHPQFYLHRSWGSRLSRQGTRGLRRRLLRYCRQKVWFDHRCWSHLPGWKRSLPPLDHRCWPRLPGWKRLCPLKMVLTMRSCWLSHRYCPRSGPSHRWRPRLMWCLRFPNGPQVQLSRRQMHLGSRQGPCCCRQALARKREQSSFFWHSLV